MQKVQYKVGDIVRVRQWDDMEQEFGLDDNGSIDVECKFIEDMREFCGREFVVTRVISSGVVHFDNTPFSFSSDMLEPITSFAEDIEKSDYDISFLF